MRLREEIKRRFPDLVVAEVLPVSEGQVTSPKPPGRSLSLNSNPFFTFSQLQQTLRSLGAPEISDLSRFKSLNIDRGCQRTDSSPSPSASQESIDSPTSEPQDSPRPPRCLFRSLAPDTSGILSQPYTDISPKPELPSSIFDSAPPPRLRTTLYLPHFNTDFAIIYTYCVDPAAFDLSRHLSELSPISRALIRLMDSHRLKELRKEQKIKKILNLVFKRLLRNFSQRTHPHLSHVTDLVKKKFCVYYFASISGGDTLFSKPDYRSRRVKGVSRPLNLTYNAKFFKNVQKCDLFVQDMLESLDELSGQVGQIIRGDTWRLLKRLEACLIPGEPEEESLTRLNGFFEKKNTFGSKIGIKIPWSEQQILESIDLVRYLARPTAVYQ